MDNTNFYNIFSSIVSDISNNTIDVSNNSVINNSVINNSLLNNMILNNLSNNNVDPSVILRLINRVRTELPNINIVNTNNTNNVNNANNANMENFINNSLQQKNKYIKVLSEKGKSQIQILKYNSSENEEKTCPITQIEFKEDEEIAKLPCDHIFNRESIMQWLVEESNKCPVCRYELDSVEKKEEKTENVQVNQTHPYGPRNRPRSFYNFLNRYYQVQEERMIQRAIENSLQINEEANDETNMQASGQHTNEDDSRFLQTEEEHHF